MEGVWGNMYRGGKVILMPYLHFETLLTILMLSEPTKSFYLFSLPDSFIGLWLYWQFGVP